MKSKYYITTAIDYANSVIHVGHAYEKVLADVVTRYLRQLTGENNVYFSTGTDEHGNSTFQASTKLGITPLEHVTKVASENKEQLDALNLSYQRFIRTTDEDHKKTAADFFQKSFDNGDIYKAKYDGLYCEGCESYKTLNELVDGKCPLHVSREIKTFEEENYFFRWKKYSSFLKNLIETNELIITPEGRRSEILAFIENGIEDIPVSRPKFKLPWGIEVPFDDEQVIYVWFDALINYYTIGSQTGFWNEDTEIIHFVGKDINKWHSLLWPAMLKSVDLPLPTQIAVHGFINLDGKKISKSLGNVIYPKDLCEKYGTDFIRYYLVKFGPNSEDSDISIAQLETSYTADFANGLGNTASRLAKMANKSGLIFPIEQANTWKDEWSKPFETFRVDLVIQNIWKKLSDLDKHINENKPWKIEDNSKLSEVLTYEINQFRQIITILEPFIPETSKKLSEIFNKEQIDILMPLFPRLT